MKNCIGCKHAEWEMTKTGRLHPSGDGRCTYEVKQVPIPASMYYIHGYTKPSGGHINRKKKFSDHCKTYERKPQ